MHYQKYTAMITLSILSFLFMIAGSVSADPISTVVPASQDAQVAASPEAAAVPNINAESLQTASAVIVNKTDTFPKDPLIVQTDKEKAGSEMAVAIPSSSSAIERSTRETKAKTVVTAEKDIPKPIAASKPEIKAVIKSILTKSEVRPVSAKIPAITPRVEAKQVKKPEPQKLIAKVISATKNLIEHAFSWLGTRYVWGGASNKGVDCSGLTKLLYSKEGVTLPHSAKAQAKIGVKVPRSKLLPGDLIFFNTQRGPQTHVGVYIGDNKFLHAANPKRGVRVDSLGSMYYNKRFATARRYKNA